MKNNALKNVLAAVFALCLALTSQAQTTTSGLTGIVTAAGKAVAGVTVTAVHEPTGTKYTATTNDTGRYSMRSMIVGGPYTLTAKASGFKVSERDDVQTQLGVDSEMPLALEATTAAETVTLDKYVVKGEVDELDASAAGAGSYFDNQRLGAKPTTQRSLADLVAASPFVTLRALSGDREEAQITALGQNNRYNSIQIDGSRINDMFGLNGTGLASFYNPLSLDTLDQLSVQVSPYEVKQSGFTGASINAVTKSGTNEFHGSGYYYFSGDHYGKLQLQGEDVTTKINSGVKFVPKLERITKGGTLGGPIWKDHIFFFLNYEKFVRTAPPSSTSLFNIDPTQLSQLKTAFNTYNTASGKNIPWGDIGGNASNVSKDKKYLAKVDWHITHDQLLTVRYSQTEGIVPQFGSFTLTTLTNSSTVPTLSANAVTAYDSNFYAQTRKEKNFTAQLVSRWTSDLSTELRFGTVEQPQQTPVNVVAPEVTIFGITGTTRTGASTNTGAVVAGTDQFRHGNSIGVKTKQYSGTGDYVYRDFVFSGGVEREYTDFYNLFRAGSYGVITFASVADFVADNPARIQRNVYDPAVRSPADLSDFALNAVFGQAKWNINPRLNVTGGIRYDFAETKKKPAFNKQLQSDSGFDNTGTLDGSNYISPRVSFNLALDAERTTQLRGGAGHFLGRTPWVFFSNSYNAIGVGSFTSATNNPGVGSFTTYMKSFDPANPIGTGTFTPGARAEVDFADKNIKLPSVWRGNLGLDKKLPFLSSTFSVEVIATKIDEAIFISNENIRPTTVGADGRQRFAGNPSTATNAKYPNFIDLYRIRNVSAGDSLYGTVSWSRPIKNHWGFDVSYTRGRSTEAQAVGQTTASGQWQRNVIFNQGAVENGTSDFEVKDRVLVSLIRDFQFYKGYRTEVSLNYEGRTGNPFSWIYSNDLNGDGQSNDVVAVPSGLNDPRFDFSGMSATDQQKYLDFFASSGLSKYAGGYAPKNSFTQPWVNKLDLHVAQDIPLHFRTAQLEVFFDWTNFGSFINRHFFNYYEEAFRLTNDVFRRQFVGPAVYGNDGRIIPQRSSITQATPNATSPDGFVFDNTQSRWRVQVGARLKF